MGLFDRFRRKPENFAGVSHSSELGDDFESTVTALHEALIEQPFVIERMGSMVVCRSPVLVLVEGEVRQPASILPEPMLARFWTDEGRAVLEGTELGAIVAQLAPHFATSDELARAALTDVHAMYVSDESPTAPWPTQDRRLRLASLLLVDVVRKLAAGFTDGELIASYGVSRSTQHDEAARQRYAAMAAREAAWMKAAVGLG